MQARYVHYHNLRSRDKSFNIGDSVLILIADSTNKTFSQWQGPAKVVERKAPYSYIVELNGARRQLHASMLRPYYTQINEIMCNVTLAIPQGAYQPVKCVSDEKSKPPNLEKRMNVENDYTLHAYGCAVISDNDSDFGQLQSVATELIHDKRDPLPSQQVDEAKLAHLTAGQRAQLLHLLDRFACCFTERPGYCDLVKHTMEINPDFKPKRFKAYRVPEKLKPAVSAEIAKLLELGFIVPMDSPQASPIIAIMKGKTVDDGIRLAVDYRYVNSHVVDCHQPLDFIPDLIQKVGNSKYISLFDAKSGYWQTPVEPSQMWINAFICDDGQFAWRRTPFGLKAAGYTFIKAMRQILQPVKDFTASYIDDCCVHSDTWRSHILQLELFLAEVANSGFTLNIKKCHFAQPEIKFLGRIVGSGKHRADPSKVATIQSLKRPETKKEIRQILGFFGHFAPYIPAYAHHARCLTALTNKRTTNRINWSQEHEDAFNALKQLLCQATEKPLYIIDYTKPFNISTDASGYAVSGILSQTDDNGTEKPIAFTSQKLTDPQNHSWSTIHKEAFAVIHSLNKFRDWILFSVVHVYSDHNPLLFITESAPTNSKLTRWALALQEFNITFHYRPAHLNFPADCISRLCHAKL